MPSMIKNTYTLPPSRPRFFQQLYFECDAQLDLGCTTRPYCTEAGVSRAYEGQRSCLHMQEGTQGAAGITSVCMQLCPVYVHNRSKAGTAFMTENT